MKHGTDQEKDLIQSNGRETQEIILNTGPNKKAEGASPPVRTDTTIGPNPPGEVLLLGSDGQCLS